MQCPSDRANEHPGANLLHPDPIACLGKARSRESPCQEGIVAEMSARAGTVRVT